MRKVMKELQEAHPKAVNGEPSGNGLPAKHGRRANGQLLPGHGGLINDSKDWNRTRRALLKTAKRRDAAGIKRLDTMADAVMDMAIAGNMSAVHFITERLDGKVTTPVDIKQDITVSSIGEAHLHALQRLTDAVTKHDEAKTIDSEATPTLDSEAVPSVDSKAGV